jgi:uncharacterized membrane protein
MEQQQQQQLRHTTQQTLLCNDNLYQHFLANYIGVHHLLVHSDSTNCVSD